MYASPHNLYLMCLKKSKLYKFSPENFLLKITPENFLLKITSSSPFKTNNCCRNLNRREMLGSESTTDFLQHFGSGKHKN